MSVIEAYNYLYDYVGVKSPPVVGASKPTLSKSVSMDVGDYHQQQQQAAPIMEDEYIEMDVVIPDPTEKAEPTTPSHGKDS